MLGLDAFFGVCSGSGDVGGIGDRGVRMFGGLG